MASRRPALTPKRLVLALGATSASVLIGALIASETVSAMDPFYRTVPSPRWREPAAPPFTSTQAPAVTYAPIGWSADPFPEPSPEPPRPDPYDDALLLDGPASYAPLLTSVDANPEPPPVDTPDPLTPERTDAETPAPATIAEEVTPDLVPG